jgi:hypothetical protein
MIAKKKEKYLQELKGNLIRINFYLIFPERLQKYFPEKSKF